MIRERFGGRPFGNVDSLRPDNLVKGLTLLPQKHSLNKVVAR